MQAPISPFPSSLHPAAQAGLLSLISPRPHLQNKAQPPCLHLLKLQSAATNPRRDNSCPQLCSASSSRKPSLAPTLRLGCEPPLSFCSPFSDAYLLPHDKSSSLPYTPQRQRPSLIHVSISSAKAGPAHRRCSIIVERLNGQTMTGTMGDAASGPQKAG